MFYESNPKAHGLAHDPFKALVAPRPIGWITAMSAKGEVNLSPQGSRMKPIDASDRSAICSETPPFAGFRRVSAPVPSPKGPQREDRRPSCVCPGENGDVSRETG